MIDFDFASIAVESCNLLEQDMDFCQMFSKNIVKSFIANAVKAMFNIDVFESEHCVANCLIFAVPTNAVFFQQFIVVFIDFDGKSFDVILTFWHSGNLVYVIVVKACDYVYHVFVLLLISFTYEIYKIFEGM